MDPVVGPSIGFLAAVLKYLPLGGYLRGRRRNAMNPRALAIVKNAKEVIRKTGSISLDAGGGPEQNDLLTAIDWLDADGYTHTLVFE